MPHTPRSAASARRAALACLALGALGVLTGCSSGAGDTPETAAPPAASSTAAGAASTPSGPPAPRHADPTRVSIPSIGVDSALMELGLNQDGTVEVPPADRGMTAGWYTGGAVPGEPGASVLIGHNDTRFGRAVFHDLKDLRKGADIAVRDARGATAHFTVTGSETVSKKAFPSDKVYRNSNGRDLRLITCDGAFDAQGHPVDNLIVYATLRQNR